MSLGRPGYLAFMLLAVGAFVLARRLFPPPRPARVPGPERLALALAAFVGGTLAAKLPFVWDADAGWWDLAAWVADGKTITTALVGAYLAVELVKLVLGVRAKTGDALAAPLAVALAVGRLRLLRQPVLLRRADRAALGCRFRRRRPPAPDAALREPVPRRLGRDSGASRRSAICCATSDSSCTCWRTAGSGSPSSSSGSSRSGSGR